MGSEEEGNGSRELGSLTTWSDAESTEMGEWQTTAQRNAGMKRDGRSDGEHKSEVHTAWWWNGRNGAPGYKGRVRNILAVSQID